MSTAMKNGISVLCVAILLVLFLQMPVCAADTTPPKSITSLDDATIMTNYINWTWKDPTDSDFSHVILYQNNIFKANVTKGVRFYNSTGLAPNTKYTLSTRTVDSSGNINKTWVNKSATTLSPDTKPPKGVTSLKNTTYVPDYIAWTWTDPTDSDFSHVMVYQDNIFKANVTKGVRFYNSTGLAANTKYTLSTRTVDTSGNINKTWVNKSATTKAIDLTPPRSVTNLKNTTYTKDYIRWDWTDPADSDFARVMVYLNGVYKGDVSKGTHSYNATGLANNTANTIGTHTVDTSGNVNQTWVNHTAWTRSGGIGNLIVSFIDVGYGDSILIESPSGETMLIDAGDTGKGDNVGDYLVSRGISSLDIAMVTHPHPDHFGGMPYILGHFDVSQFIDNGQTGNGYSGAVLDDVKDLAIPHRTVRSGDAIALDSLITIQVLNPQTTLIGDDNQDSIALKVVYNQDSFLLMADAMSTAENKIISSGKDLNVDVLKVGHHGDKDGTSATFLSKVTPVTCIISVGSNDSGLPSNTLIERLENIIGNSIYRTDKNGNVVVTSNGLQYTVITEE